MNFMAITFSHPWLLFLLIAAVLLTLIPHLRIAKKYRRNRNRITSLVLHLIVLTLSIFVLAGMKFEYTLTNTENEIILLVDVSNSEDEVAENRDDTVETILYQNGEYGYKIGVVVFGFDQKYAAELSTDYKKVLSDYQAFVSDSANMPDVNATDIASALTYTKELFTNPEAGKIVLITDGKETDESALTTVRSVSATGVKVDVCYIDSTSKAKDVQIYGITEPTTHITLNNEVEYKFNIKSNYDNEEIQVILVDNGVEDTNTAQTIKLSEGTSEFSIKHAFSEVGLHSLEFKIKNATDSENNEIKAYNNSYMIYVNLQTFTKILVIEAYEGESENLKATLTSLNYDVTVCNLLNDNYPKTVKELREYDQVILNNVANSDLPENINGATEKGSKQIDFIDLLEEYVSVYGGGLLTTAGLDADGLKAHAYNREDLSGEKLQEMLPVQAIEYTPPLGVIFIIDTSGSMSSTLGDGSGKTALEAAVDAAIVGVRSAVTERDLIGVMTLSTQDSQEILLGLTPATQQDRIISAINILTDEEYESGGGTDFLPAIEQACTLLNARTDIAKKHIIVISDGGAGDATSDTGYKVYADYCYKQAEENDIITSFVIVGHDSLGDDDKSSLTYASSGIDENHYGEWYQSDNLSEIAEKVRNDIKMDAIKDVEYEDYKAVINRNNYPSIFTDVETEKKTNGSEELTYQFTGYAGTKVKSSSYLVLTGPYSVPIYAQWKYGEGSVGSLMVDLKGTWANELLSSTQGQLLLKNVINEVMPLTDIRANETDVRLRSDNYINQISVSTTLSEGDTVKGSISYTSDSGEDITVSLNELPSSESDLRSLACYVTTPLSLANDYSRCNFVIRESGVYTIVVAKYDKDGNIVGEETTIYKSFAYSDEYDQTLIDETYDMASFIENIADRGRGEVIKDNEDPKEVFESFEQYINKVFDPRIMFMIIAIVLFLTDIAVRKFKFKWPHELIQNYKEKKQKEASNK